ncbi:MAG TPA: DUF1906 domain-containing protein [Streptosporangiaceae bacterium]|nr:DUF1906 domain-containing protein [Streptosporangiaceae bacterium]
MLAKGLDASFDPPNYGQAHRQGYRFIGRYLCPTPSGKVIDPDEVKRIHAAKLGLFLGWENKAADALRGRPGGLADGRKAHDLARDWIKYPKGSVIFFSVGDFDVQPEQFPAVAAYLDGVREALGGYYKIGAYGGAGLLRHLKAKHKAAYFWQACASTAWYQNASKMAEAHFHQTTIDVKRADGTVDIDEQNLPAPIWYPTASHVASHAAPKIVRVPSGAGASGKPGALNVYSYVELNPTGKLIVQLAAHFPKAQQIYVTSGMDGDHGPKPDGSYHYGHLKHGGSPAAAVDFGAYDMAGTDKGDRRMRDLARWFEDVVPGAANIVELIHTTPYADNNGFYVKDGQVIASYDPETDAAHRNHVHLAMSRKQVTAVLAHIKASHPAPS